MIRNRVEQAGIDLVMPLLESWADGKRVYDTHKTRDPLLWQRTFGDYVIHPVWDKEATLTIEVKTEEKFTGRLPAEVWSHYSHDEYARPGWLKTLQTDALLNVYLDARLVVVSRFPRLRNWCLKERNIRRYAEKGVRAFEAGNQMNDTRNALIPFAHLWEPTGLKAWLWQNGEWKPATLADVNDARQVRCGSPD